MELCEILHPFKQATVKIQADKTVSASMAIPVINGLKLFLNTVRCEYSRNLVTKLRQSLEQRMSIYTEDDTFITAAILDPRFKLTWCNERQMDDYARSLRTKVINCTPIPAENESASPPRKRTKFESGDLFSYLPSTPKRSRNQSGTTSEVDEYLEEYCIDREEGDPLDYWKRNATKYPNLAILAVKFLAVPTSSAPVERLFSIAGKIFRPDRCRLDNTFEKLYQN